MKIYYESPILQWSIFKHTNAIVLCKCILFKKAKKDISDRLMAHEMVHVHQIVRLGVFKFYLLYAYYYIKNYLKYFDSFEAYWNNPFEIEARNESKKYVNDAKYVSC